MYFETIRGPHSVDHDMLTCYGHVFRNSCSTETSPVILLPGAPLWWSEPNTLAEFVLGRVKTAIVRLSLTQNLTWPCFQCFADLAAAVLKAIADLWLHPTSALCPGCALQLHFTLGQSRRLQSCRGISYRPQSSDYVERTPQTASYQNEAKRKSAFNR